MNDMQLIIKLKNEGSRSFFKKLEQIFKSDEEFTVSMRFDINNISHYDTLEIDFLKTPSFLKNKEIKRTFIELRNYPNMENKNEINFTFFSKPDASEQEFEKILALFNKKILERYNMNYDKKYQIINNVLTLSPKLKESFNDYIKALKRGANKSDRIYFYRFITSCHQYRSNINEVSFKNLLENENIDESTIKDQAIRFFSCIEFYKFLKNKL